MVDVTEKPHSARRAEAEGRIRMLPATLALILAGGHAKGDVLAVARLAGIMAAKKTAELIPLCHPIPISAIELVFAPLTEESAIHCRALVTTQAQTGVEMEALMAVEIALLTIYDMCKSVDHGMTLTDIRLLAKSGGRSGDWRRAPEPDSE